VEADPNVTALCRELLAATVRVPRVQNVRVGGSLTGSCVLSTVNRTNREKPYRCVQSETCNAYSVEVLVIKGIRWNEIGVLR
jgi:hypothetical protein